MTGPQLREQRAKANVKAADLAAKMGVGRTRVPQIEATAAPSEAIVSRYIAALIELAAEAKAAA